MPIPLKSVSD